MTTATLTKPPQPVHDMLPNLITSALVSLNALHWGSRYYGPPIYVVQDLFWKDLTIEFILISLV